MILCRTPQYPTNVGPPATMTWRMRISCSICVRVMYAVRYYPLDWTTLECEGATGHQKILNQFWHFVAAMSKQPVIAHTDTQTAANPVKDNCGNHCRPAPKEKRCNRSKMRAHQENATAPIPIGPIDLGSLA